MRQCSLLRLCKLLRRVSDVAQMLCCSGAGQLDSHRLGTGQSFEEIGVGELALCSSQEQCD